MRERKIKNAVQHTAKPHSLIIRIVKTIEKFPLSKGNCRLSKKYFAYGKITFLSLP